MIHVLARITLKPGMAPLFLREFYELAALVRQEIGCLDYFPTQDVPLGLDIQEYSPDSVTIVEKWASRNALEVHLRSGNLRAFHERVHDLVEDTRLTIMHEV
ncbi:hypothetical protein MASR1M90_18000 [Desulfovibrionales bacterium]